MRTLGLPFPELGRENYQHGIEFQPAEQHQNRKYQLAELRDVRVVLRRSNRAESRPDIGNRRR